MDLIELEGNIDNSIKENETRLQAIYAQMENLKVDFTNQVTTFSAAWYDKTVKEYIAKYPQVILKMKKEQVAQMKQQVVILKRGASKNVAKEMANSNLWWHQTPNISESADRYLQVADKYPAVLDNAVRHVLGLLGAVLESFGFNVSTSRSGTFPEFWYDNQPDSMVVLPYFPHKLDWPIDVQYTVQKYEGRYLEALELFRQTQALKDEKQRRLASSLWEDV